MDDDCVFCKIVAGELPSVKVFENETVLAFRDTSPIAPVHVLIIPKAHRQSLNDVTEADAALLGEILLITKKVAVLEGVAESGYRVVTNTGRDGAQRVDHLHFHLLGGRQMSARLE